MHISVEEFSRQMKDKFPENFQHSRVLDVGSLDINGNNRYLFDNCDYIGLDLGAGPNVDEICSAHLYKTDRLFDTIISTEAFEHDKNFKASMDNIYNLLREGGLFLFTCATTGRQEHGTPKNDITQAPFTNDYYHNVSLDELPMLAKYTKFYIEKIPGDLRFCGIK